MSGARNMTTPTTAGMRDALERLADAADAVGVRFFDTDTMEPEVEEMQAATQAARAALSTKQERKCGAGADVKCNDAEIVRIWRECGLPEYFLGNGGSNHKLVAFAKACAALKPLPAPDDWRDMESAPKDGTRILLSGGVYLGLPFPGYWDESFYKPLEPWVNAIDGHRLYAHAVHRWRPLPAPSEGKETP